MSSEVVGLLSEEESAVGADRVPGIGAQLTLIASRESGYSMLQTEKSVF